VATVSGVEFWLVAYTCAHWGAIAFTLIGMAIAHCSTHFADDTAVGYLIVTLEYASLYHIVQVAL